MFNSFSKYVLTTGLNQKTDQLIVAISGGVDSVVLTDLLIESGFNIILAHMNYGLRGVDSNEDEQFVRQLAENWRVGIEVNKVDTKELKIGSGKSTQMLARDLRYNWFSELCKKHNSKLVTAHHAGDATETFLLNLVRGTGIKGLTGMHFEKNNVLRPLLNYSKQEIVTYAQSKGLIWREDKSNKSNDYKRNSLRNEVIPLLKKMNPNFDATVERVASRLENVNELLVDAVQVFKSGWVSFKTGIRIPLPKQVNPEVLYYSLSEFNFNYDDVLNLIQIMNAGLVGKKIVSKSHELYLDRAELHLLKLEDVDMIDEKLVIGENTNVFGKNVNIQKVAQVNKELISNTLQFFNSDKMHGEIKLRYWREGDIFKPLGMNGKQKVSDFLINNKVPLSEKRKVLVLTVHGDIAWLVGFRISEDFKVLVFDEPNIKIIVD